MLHFAEIGDKGCQRFPKRAELAPNDCALFVRATHNNPGLRTKGCQYEVNSKLIAPCTLQYCRMLRAHASATAAATTDSCW